MEKDRTKRRYQPGKKIGAGSFATVFVARDLKLNRDVAIKQLHAQYLKDQIQLKRYWQEAQLLGSIEHPNVMTIYDVLQSKGCLILEKMRGSLKEVYANKPMPVEEVRQTILQSAKGLQCLHDNGIIHGDIKPGNLFLSRQDVVKLGDFGLARRVNDEDGSLVKGTTRYMAPELVSEDFGDVGPASDLYSLGFSALEMLVGPEFESLFPDLIAFGRDRQMAWMMWHCSADRKLPPIQSLLSGVPDDVARVLSKLTTKNQSERYHHASEVISDLSKQATPVGKSLKDDELEAERLALAKRNKRRKLWAACLSSLLLSSAIVAYVMWPKKPEEHVKIPEAVRGVVQNILTIDQKLVLDIGTDWKEFTLQSGDQVTLNRKERQLRDLQENDRVVVHSRLTPENKIRYDIVAFRPETHTGVIQSINGEENQFSMKVTEGEEVDTEFQLSVPEATPISLNAKSEMAGEPHRFQSLAEGDRVIVNHSDDESGMLALSVDAFRETTLIGYARKIDVRKKLITVALEESEQNSSSFVRIPLANNCIIQLNDNASLNEKLVTFGDLLPGDKVTLHYETKVSAIDAFRVFRDEGDVLEVNVAGRKLTIASDQFDSNRVYILDSELDIKLGSESIGLEDFRTGDQVKLSHVFPGQAEPSLQTLDVTRPANRKKWAIFIANETFKDAQISPLDRSIDSATALREKLVTRYAVPEDQMLYCEDFVGVRLQKEIPDWLRQIPADAELYIYLSTRAFAETNKNVYLAAQDSNLEKIDETGIRFDWLIDQLDRCRTKQKLLLLDCTPMDSVSDDAQVSSEEMIEVVRSTHRGGYPRSLYVLGATRKGQVGTNIAETPLSLFAESLVQGFGGEADQGADNQIEITELADYVEKAVSQQSSSQRPVLFLPDPSPPRISDRAKASLIDFLSRFGQKKMDLELVEEEFEVLKSLAPSEPEPTLAFGILLLKASKIDRAFEQFEKVRLSHPDSIPAHRCAIWINFYKTRYDDGVEKMLVLLDQIPLPEDMDKDYTERTLAIFEWAGRLRELAGAADWTGRIPTANELEKLDSTINKFGQGPMDQYASGRKTTREKIDQFDSDIAADPRSNSRLKKTKIRSYVDSIADEKLITEVKDGLDK